MHNNYYFLKHLSRALGDKLTGFRLQECFSQNRNELILGFANSGAEFYIKALLEPAFCCLSFPKNFSRARKNSVDLFESLRHKEVAGIHQFENERCFALLFENTYRLLFKMHGNRSNIILYEGTQVSGIFKGNLKKDLELDIKSLDRPIDQTYESFLHHNGNYRPLFPTFGKVIENYLLEQRMKEMDTEGKWRLIQDTLSQLERPNFYTTMLEDQLQLSLLRTGAVQQVFHNPIEAIDTFFIEFITQSSLNSQKKGMLTGIDKQIKQTRNYVKKAEHKLREIEERLDYSRVADLLMANLHRIAPKAEMVTLENFYNNNQPVTIKLKRDLSPQKNAEAYYRKAKNQAVEIETIRTNLAQKEQLIQSLETQKAIIEQETDLRSIRTHLKRRSSSKSPKMRPFNSFGYGGYDIWVGKNAKNNDEMLQQYASKDDLWLHAREVTGSHVLVKHQAGRKFPKDVIEKAAELAAYHSKRRSDSLCPVIVTPRKFVRKRKGDPAGAVVVDKEDQVILVKPTKWA